MRFIIDKFGIFSSVALVFATLWSAPVLAVKAQPNASPSHHCDTRLSALKTNLGGYCRGPSNKRVIVFVNGIFGDAVDTWSNGNSYWPELLAEDSTFDGADIYVHSFLSPTLATAQEIDELAGRMTDFLVNDAVFSKHEQVVFVAHSMGGLVVRAYLVKRRPAPSRVPMIYFFATPTTGANVAGVAAHLSKNSQLKYMLPIEEDGYVGDLQNAWLSTSDDPHLNYPSTIASFCAYEKLDTWGFRVVTRGSATNLCNRETRGIVRDHIGIVKPTSTSDDSYAAFKAAYIQTFGHLNRLAQRAVALAQHDRAAERYTPAKKSGSEEQPAVTKMGDEWGSVEVHSFMYFQSLFVKGCSADRRGMVEIPYGIPKTTRILEIVPTIEDADEIDPESSSVALVSYSDKSAKIRYHLRVVPKVVDRIKGVVPKGRRAKDCMGLADIAIDIVTTFPQPQD